MEHPRVTAAGFPLIRPRRLRTTPAIRRMVRETRLHPDQLVLPMFAVDGAGVEEPIASLKGHSRLSADLIAARAARAYADGVPAVLLFGVSDTKDEEATASHDPDGAVQRAVAAVKDRVPEMCVITDVCLCAYTSHGHCGVVVDGRVDNDPSLEILARAAVSHADAGADVVAPSDMMDGRVAVIRQALDAEGHAETAIMSYSSKYASAFYGPFRDAAGSAPGFGDRSGYQMDPANAREAVRESLLDEAEGADFLMVKPAATYLDVIRDVSRASDLPLAAYHVSGEYAMLKAAAERGWLDERDATLETLTAIIRAGADLVITYAAEDAARWIQEAQ